MGSRQGKSISPAALAAGVVLTLNAGNTVLASVTIDTTNYSAAVSVFAGSNADLLLFIVPANAVKTVPLGATSTITLTSPSGASGTVYVQWSDVELSASSFSNLPGTPIQQAYSSQNPQASTSGSVLIYAGFSGKSLYVTSSWINCSGPSSAVAGTGAYVQLAADGGPPGFPPLDMLAQRSDGTVKEVIQQSRRSYPTPATFGGSWQNGISLFWGGFSGNPIITGGFEGYTIP